MGLKNRSQNKTTIQDNSFAATSHDHRTSTSPIYIHPPSLLPHPTSPKVIMALIVGQTIKQTLTWAHALPPWECAHVSDYHLVPPRPRCMHGCTTGRQQDHSIIIIAAPNVRSGGFRTMAMVQNGIINGPEILRVSNVAQHVAQVQGHQDNQNAS